MADVTTAPRDRAQLILVSGLLIAATLLVLVLMLNTAIYTENVATRGMDSDARAVQGFQENVDAEVTAIIQAEQRTTDASGYEQLESNVSNGTDHLLTTLSNRSLERGWDVRTAHHIRPGVTVQTPWEGPLPATVITNVETVRQYTVEINTSSLDTDANESALTIESGTDDITVNRTAEETVELWMDGERRCTIDATTFTLNITNGTVSPDGDGCSVFLDPVSDVDDARLAIQPNDDVNATGSVDLVLEGDDIDVESGDAEWFVAQVTVELQVVSADIRYETVRTIQGALPP